MSSYWMNLRGAHHFTNEGRHCLSSGVSETMSWKKPCRCRVNVPFPCTCSLQSSPHGGVLRPGQLLEVSSTLTLAIVTLYVLCFGRLQVATSLASPKVPSVNPRIGCRSSIHSPSVLLKLSSLPQPPLGQNVRPLPKYPRKQYSCTSKRKKKTVISRTDGERGTFLMRPCFCFAVSEQKKKKNPKIHQREHVGLARWPSSRWS